MALTVRQWRLAKEITQQTMAEKLGVHVNTYMSWEKEPENISVTNARKISEILELPFDEIRFESDPE